MADPRGGRPLAAAEVGRLDSRSQQIIAELSEGFVSLDTHLRLSDCNAAAERLLGRKREALLGRDFFEISGLGTDSALAKLARLVADTKKREDAELTYQNGARSRLIAVRAFPLDDGIGAVWRDITGERAAARRLLLSEARYREIADGIPTAAWLSRANGKLEFINQAMADALGRPRRDLLGDRWLEAVDPADRARLLRVRAQARAEHTSFHYEGRFLRPDGAPRVIELFGRPRFDAQGAFGGHVGIAADVTDVRAAERRQQVLIDELNHRVKNTLATVQSLVRHTLQEHGAPKRVERDVTERLLALAAAHDVLSRQHWEGAELTDVTNEVLRPHRHSGQVSVSGPEARLSPKTAIALAMGLGELAANAAKHGALSARGGSVALSWTKSGDAIDLEWRESGGPPVAAARLSGFGSVLLGRLLAVELGRAAEVSYEPDGLICRIWAPLAAA